MENSILEAINYVSKISRQKVTVESISTFLNKKGPSNIEDQYIMEALKDMQDKGVINKYNRLINLKSPQPTEIPTTAEKVNVANIRSIHDSMNKTFPLLLNRSLPTTPPTTANTTPRLFSIDNSTLNSKLESLESKLHGKIVAMKQFFMDELQSLKRETQLSQTMDSCNEFEDRNMLENKIKMLEFENNLLKNDISNKQKFIDTILEHNGKLLNNQTINNSISTVKKKTITNGQEHIDEMSDVGLNNEQTVIENDISEQHENKNEKNDKEKNDRGNDKSKKAKIPIDDKKKNKKIYILGDSMVKHVEGWQLSKSTNQKVYVRSFTGAKVKCMKDYVKPCIGENDPDHVIMHVGTNEMNSELPPERIAKSVIDVAKNVKTDTRSVSISGIIPRNDNFNNKVMEVNKELAKMCKREKFQFLEHSNINPKAHLNKSKVHLNRNGYIKLGKNFANFINNNNNA